MQSLANFIMNVNILLNVEKTKIKVKEAGNCPFLRTIVLLTLCLFCSSVPISFLRQKGDAKFEKKSSPSSLSDSSFLYFFSFEREKRFQSFNQTERRKSVEVELMESGDKTSCSWQLR